MTCPHCKTQNYPNAPRCMRCGNSLALESSQRRVFVPGIALGAFILISGWLLGVNAHSRVNELAWSISLAKSENVDQTAFALAQDSAKSQRTAAIIFMLTGGSIVALSMRRN